MIELLFPPEAQLIIEDVRVKPGKINIYARRRDIGASCPDCRRASEKIHSRYHRHPYDLPCFGFRVQLHLCVRRFFCQNTGCSRGGKRQVRTNQARDNGRTAPAASTRRPRQAILERRILS
jgi:transposase